MTDFIAYISAQQRMQADMTYATSAPVRRGDRRHVTRSGFHIVRQTVSVALHRLAVAIQPGGAIAGTLGDALR